MFRSWRRKLKQWMTGPPSRVQGRSPYGGSRPGLEILENRTLLSVDMGLLPPSLQGLNLFAWEEQQFTAPVARILGSVISDQPIMIDWGDGQSSVGTLVQVAEQTYDVLGSTTYSEPGSFTVQIKFPFEDGTSIKVESQALISDALLDGQFPATGLPDDQTMMDGIVTSFTATDGAGDGQTFVMESENLSFPPLVVTLRRLSSGGFTDSGSDSPVQLMAGDRIVFVANMVAGPEPGTPTPPEPLFPPTGFPLPLPPIVTIPAVGANPPAGTPPPVLASSLGQNVQPPPLPLPSAARSTVDPTTWIPWSGSSSTATPAPVATPGVNYAALSSLPDASRLTGSSNLRESDSTGAQGTSPRPGNSLLRPAETLVLRSTGEPASIDLGRRMMDDAMAAMLAGINSRVRPTAHEVAETVPEAIAPPEVIPVALASQERRTSEAHKDDTPILSLAAIWVLLQALVYGAWQNGGLTGDQKERRAGI